MNYEPHKPVFVTRNESNDMPFKCEWRQGCDKPWFNWCHRCDRYFCWNHSIHHMMEGERMATNYQNHPVTGGIEGVTGDNTDRTTFKSGAVRSEKAPPWYMLPWEAVRVVLERFNIGAYKKGYGVHNWKRAIGSGDLEFIRQLFDHLMTHLMLFTTNVGTWNVDREGKHANETPMDHLAAAGWGILTLITYTLYDRKNVQKAFSLWPEAWDKEPPVHIPPTNEFEVKDNQWVPYGRPEPPSDAADAPYAHDAWLKGSK